MTNDVDAKGSSNTQVGNISNSKGIAVGHGASATVNDGGVSLDAIAKAFVPILDKVNALPETAGKTIALQATQALQSEAAKGEAADEKTVGDWFNFLAQAAPDVFEVAVATFANPIAGLGIAFKKIADRAKADKASRQKEAEKKQ